MKKLLISIIFFCFLISNLFADPTPNRGPEYADYLDASIFIQVGHKGGSGTIIYYDPYNNNAYVASCGHLWDYKGEECYIQIWYQNKTRLSQPKWYKGQCLFYNNSAEYDCSLVVFKPDWRPTYFSIANYNPEVNKNYVSTGCDNGTEVAAYLIRIIKIDETGTIHTYYNSPRGGRSGGGLLDGAYYVGICTRSSDKIGGNGYGQYTGLPALRAVYKQNGYDWLLNLPPYDFARRIPIINHTNPNKRYNPSYITIP